MLAILPRYRVSQEYLFGPSTVHLEEDPVGYELAFAEGQSEALDGVWPNARQMAVRDIIHYCLQSDTHAGFGHDMKVADILFALAWGDTCPVVTFEEAIAADRTIIRWCEERRPAWLEERQAAFAIEDPEQ